MGERQALEARRKQVEMAIPRVAGDEARAVLLLELGCLLEKLEEWESAAARYRDLLACQPAHPVLRYFGRNNLGYCLVIMGDYDAAEDYCREALDVDDARHNAHKNLGLALLGQGRWLDAAYSLLAAVELQPADPRALAHLEHLIASQPAVFQIDEAFAGEMQRVLNRISARPDLAHVQ